VVTGTVRFWQDELGWGVLDSDETPGGCWAHFSALRVPGYRALSAGERVHFDWEAGQQDGYSYRATIAWPDGVDPTSDDIAAPTESTAYRSSLTITWDDPDHGRDQEDGQQAEQHGQALGVSTPTAVPHRHARYPALFSSDGDPGSGPLGAVDLALGCAAAASPRGHY
jgi:cold shock protein